MSLSKTWELAKRKKFAYSSLSPCQYRFCLHGIASKSLSSCTGHCILFHVSFASETWKLRQTKNLRLLAIGILPSTKYMYRENNLHYSSIFFLCLSAFSEILTSSFILMLLSSDKTSFGFFWTMGNLNKVVREAFQGGDSAHKLSFLKHRYIICLRPKLTTYRKRCPHKSCCYHLLITISFVYCMSLCTESLLQDLCNSEFNSGFAS